MADASEALKLDPKDFKLSSYDNLSISMPEKPVMGEDDVDAQLFQYVISSGKQINSIADLDDAWVQSNFDGLETIDDVRQAIKDDYDRNLEFEYSDMKFRACSDEMVNRLEGDIDEDVLQANIDAMRHANEERLDAMHITMEQYLKEEHLTPDQYEDKLRDETLYQLRLNMALDLMADVLGMQVGNHEITEYLQTPNPEAFLEEIREKDMVEEARQAATRVKTMRRAVDTALVNGEIETPASKAAMIKERVMQEEDDEEVVIPDLENLPEAEIRDDNPFRLTIIDD